MQERRATPRSAVRVAVRIVTRDGVFDATMVNISHDGVRLSMDERRWRERFSAFSRARLARLIMQTVYDLVPVIGAVISAHCRETSAREQFLRECLSGRWEEVRNMIDGMLAEPSLLRGHQEMRLRDFLDLLSDAPAPQHPLKS